MGIMVYSVLLWVILTKPWRPLFIPKPESQKKHAAGGEVATAIAGVPGTEVQHSQYG